MLLQRGVRTFQYLKQNKQVGGLLGSATDSCRLFSSSSAPLTEDEVVMLQTKWGNAIKNISKTPDPMRSSFLDLRNRRRLSRLLRLLKAFVIGLHACMKIAP